MRETAEQTNFEEEAVNKQNIVNNFKREIEELTGGRYDRVTADGLEKLTTFYNWKKIVEVLIVMLRKNMKKISKWDAVSGFPLVKLEWIIWKQQGIPTDNFSHDQQAEQGRGPEGENLQSNWINKNPDKVANYTENINKRSTSYC